MTTSLAFHPFIGDRFEGEIRPLFVAESHYGTEDCQRPDFTTEVVRAHGIDEQGSFFRNIPEIAFGLPWKAIQHKEAWSRVAFCNLVQQIVANPRGDVTWAMLERGAALLPAAIEMVNPTVLVILGNSAWGVVQASRLFSDLDEADGTYYRGRFQGLPVVFSYHPSGSRFDRRKSSEALGEVLRGSGVSADTIEAYSDAVRLPQIPSALLRPGSPDRPRPLQI